MPLAAAGTSLVLVIVGMAFSESGSGLAIEGWGAVGALSRW